MDGKKIYMPVIKPVEFIKKFDKKLNTSLCVPSVSNGYSMCIEYITGWVKSKFQSDYFKSVYIADKNILDDFRSKSRLELSKKLKPALAITPQVDLEYDREHVDLYNYGTNLYYNRCNYKDAFFKDMTKNNYISIAMEILQMNFNIKIKVSSRNHALDLAKFIQMAFRCNGTQGKYVDLDIHVPTELMVKVAMDSGFEVKKNEVTDMLGFLYYLNKHSQLAFMYKPNTSKQKYEYFIKVPQMYIHTRTEPVTVDDGEREAQISNNYVANFDCIVRFPVPKFYAYYSLSTKEFIRAQSTDGTYTVYELCVTKVPKVNSKGWNQYLTTEFMQDDTDYKNKTPLDVNIGELFIGNGGKGRLKEIMEYTKSLYLSPSVFTEIKLFNDCKEISCSIDWSTYILSTTESLTNQKSFLSIYVDLQYINDQQININKWKESRIS
jgi:hypothetical protein